MNKTIDEQIQTASLAVEQLLLGYARHFNWTGSQLSAAHSCAVTRLNESPALNGGATPPGTVGGGEVACVLAEAPQESGADFMMCREATSLWVTVGNVSVYLKRTDEGLIVDLFPKGAESNCLGTAGILFQEAEAGLAERLGVDVDEVEAAMGVAFADASHGERAEMLVRYAYRLVK